MTALNKNVFQYIHMVEKDNRLHLQAVNDVRQGEVSLSLILDQEEIANAM